MIRVEDINVDNVEDVFKVCSYNKLEDPLQQSGITLKRQWLLGMLRKYGPCTKLAYYDDKPVAQILYYPESAAPFITNPREDVVFINCVYNPFPQARGKGAGTALINKILHECRDKLPILRGKPCRFIVVKPFNTGEGIPLDKFYRTNGFKQGQHEMFHEIAAEYIPRVMGEYRPLPEDRGRAVMFYDPTCEFSYPFAVHVKEFLQGIDTDLPVDLINSWLQPEESIRRGNQGLIVNATVIRSFWTEKEKFRNEVIQALDK